MPGAGHQHPGPGGAGLAGVEQAVGHADLDRGGQVGVVEDDVGRLAAQFEGDPLDLLGGERADPPAGPGRAGERDHVDVGVGRQRLAGDRAVPGHEVVDAGRQAGVVGDLGEQVRRERRDLARLVHHGAAGRERRRDLRHGLVERVVPRGDGADHADRLAHDQRVADPLGRLVGPQQVHGRRRGPAAARPPAPARRSRRGRPSRW